MISYKGITYCSGDGCTKFDGCDRALTKEVIESAKKWWRGPNPPISSHANPKQQKCHSINDTKP